MLKKRELKERYEQEGERLTYEKRVYPPRDWQHRKILSIVDRYFGLIPRKGTVLDIGCAEGLILRRFAEHMIDGVGLDIATTKIRKGQDLSIGFKDIKYVVGDAENLPFKDEFFDIVLCIETLEHLPNPKDALLEVVRALKSNGHAIISVPTASTFYSRLRKVLTKKDPAPANDVGHIQIFTFEQIFEILLNHFSVIDISPIFLVELPYHHVYAQKPIIGSVFKLIDALLARIPALKRYGFWTVFYVRLENKNLQIHKRSSEDL